MQLECRALFGHLWLRRFGCCDIRFLIVLQASQESWHCWPLRMIAPLLTLKPSNTF